MTFNGNRIKLPKPFTKKLKDKFKLRHMMEREPLLFHIMLRQRLQLVHIGFQGSSKQKLYKVRIEYSYRQ